jgi:ABC-type multidrug transport system ATPase subunit
MFEYSFLIKMAMGLVLEADSIYYSIDGHEILKGAYLTCKQGEIVGLLGRNGCGKSTMLEIIFGTRRGAHSFVRIGGKVYTGKAFRSGKLRMQPQFDYIPKGMRISIILWMEGFCKKDIKDELILEIYDCKVGELSGGLLKYFQIFIFLQSPVPFIILDEPFAGLSPVAVEHVVGLLEEAKKTKGIILSDHNYEAVDKITDKLMYMQDGQIQEIAGLGEIKGLYF